MTSLTTAPHKGTTPAPKSSTTVYCQKLKTAHRHAGMAPAEPPRPVGPSPADKERPHLRSLLHNLKLSMVAPSTTPPPPHPSYFAIDSGYCHERLVATMPGLDLPRVKFMPHPHESDHHRAY